jgi:tripartite-type tricarboxylate transporter receptor subunit TctC
VTHSVAAFLASLALAGAACAEGFASRPIRILVGVPPGATTDYLARLVALEIARDTGQAAFVENRPGAGATIAAKEVARSTPDGNTLLFTNTSHSVNPGLYGERLPYDALRDFTPIALLAQGPSVLIATADFPAADARGVIALARAQPGKLEFAVGGFGTSVHMAGELFKSMAHVEILNVPYTGSAPALADIVGGQVKLMFAPVINAVPQVRAGRIKALGITGTHPVPALPGVPPIADALPGYESVAYFGLLGPAKLPADVVRRLNASAARVLTVPEVKARLEADGTVLVGSSPEAFREFLLVDIEKWRKVVRLTGAKPE